MKRRFSHRVGAVKPPQTLQIEEMDSALKNSLWNVIVIAVYDDHYSNWVDRTKLIWKEIVNTPIDELPDDGEDCRDRLKKWVFSEKAKWYQIYEMIEFISDNAEQLTVSQDPEKFRNDANRSLEDEFSGFRFSSGILYPFISEIENKEITEAHKNLSYYELYGAKTHLEASLNYLRPRQNPDYRNSIKESISAIESLIKLISKEKKGGLKKALNKLDEIVPLHPSFKLALLNFYGYSSNQDGVRHALLDKPNVSHDDAIFMLVCCSAFVNFLISKAQIAGIL